MNPPEPEPPQLPINHHPDDTFGLCLCCGSPFQPTIEAMIQKKASRLANLALLHFEMLMREDESLLSLLRPSKQPHFVQPKQNAHVVHKSHHAHALKYALDTAYNHRKVDNFPFLVAPTSQRRSRAYFASWPTQRSDDRVDLKPLWNLIMNDLIMPDVANDIPHFSWEENMTVPTCVDCNMCMTSLFWYRFHLYTSRSINPKRIIPDEVIKVWNVQVCMCVFS